MVLIQYVFGHRSMRETIKRIETDVAYRWFIGYGFSEKIPHFSTFSKNYERRFHDTDLFETIFYRILRQAMDLGLVDPSVAFIDSTHVKANANKKKFVKKIVRNKHQRISNVSMMSILFSTDLTMAQFFSAILSAFLICSAPRFSPFNMK